MSTLAPTAQLANATIAIANAKADLLIRNAQARVLRWAQSGVFPVATEQALREQARACQDVNELAAMEQTVLADYLSRGGVEVEASRSGLTIGKGEGINAF